MYRLGSARATDLPEAIFFCLAMIWYTVAKNINNKQIPPRARSRFCEARTRLCDFSWFWIWAPRAQPESREQLFICLNGMVHYLCQKNKR